MRKFYKPLLAIALAASSLFASAQERSTGTHGYYKDVFMDAGINLTSKKDLPSTRFLGLSWEAFISASHDPVNYLSIMDTVIQKEMICGNPWDANGVLLYPDGSPRFRMIYMNGGKATSHGNSLTPQGRENIRKFVENGGSYVGTCAGFFISSNGVYKEGEEYTPNDKYLSIWPGTAHTTGLYDSYTAMESVEGSPLLKYFQFGGDGRVDSLYHWGGAYAYYGEGGIIPEGTEPLMRYVYDTVAADAPTRHMHNQVSSLAYKKSAQTGRVVVTGSHPESITSGDRLEYMAAMMLYAMDGNGTTRVKGELKPGELREMKKKTEDNDPLYTRIGDLQYHHFTVSVPEGTKKAIVTLAGYKGKDNFDLSVMAKAGEFAFHHNTEIKNVDRGCSKNLVIENPVAGEWYISVRCESTVVSRRGEYGTEYLSGREVLNGVPYSIRVDFDAAPAVQESDAVGTLAVHPSESRDGYYKDIFMDSGIKLTARKFLPSARHLEAEYEVFSRTDNTLRDTVMQHRCFVGTEMDSNGILLYPDGAARYKVVYVNGGLATRHGSSLGPDGRERFRQYVNGGGSFVGTCAGGFIGTTGIINVDNSFEVNQEYLHLWPGRTRDTYLAGKRFKMYMEPNSPLLRYYDYGGDFQVDSIFHNNGGYAALDVAAGDPVPVGTEPLLRVDWNEAPRKGPSIDNQVCCWGYKANENTGRVILMSSHPEAVTTGERMHLMAAFFQYAMDGNGAVTVKGNLVPGEVREMNKSTEDNDPLFTKIGDRQYHHFTVDIPKRVKKVEIELSGYEGADNFDLTLAVRKDGYAFHKDTYLKDVSKGCNKRIVLEKPAADKWYISVFCETTVTPELGDNGVVYTGRTDVLNGVPYKIKVTYTK